MAKLSRDVLKGIVKECLVEILAEGLSSTSSDSSVSKPVKKQPPHPAPRRPAPDMISMGSGNSQTSNSAVEQRIAKAAGGNNMMESILRDTAKNTLPTMMAADGKKDRSIAGRSMAERMTNGDAATKTMAATDPMDIFEGASNWATLAFADATRK